jgi:hypothetical protein
MKQSKSVKTLKKSKLNMGSSSKSERNRYLNRSVNSNGRSISKRMAHNLIHNSMPTIQEKNSSQKSLSSKKAMTSVDLNLDHYTTKEKFEMIEIMHQLKKSKNYIYNAPREFHGPNSTAKQRLILNFAAYDQMMDSALWKTRKLKHKRVDRRAKSQEENLESARDSKRSAKKNEELIKEIQRIQDTED